MTSTGISRKLSDSPEFSRVWGFSKVSRISKFSRISRKWTFLKRPLFQKNLFPNRNLSPRLLQIATYLPSESERIRERCLAHKATLLHDNYERIWLARANLSGVDESTISKHLQNQRRTCVQVKFFPFGFSLSMNTTSSALCWRH